MNETHVEHEETLGCKPLLDDSDQMLRLRKLPARSGDNPDAPRYPAVDRAVELVNGAGVEMITLAASLRLLLVRVATVLGVRAPKLALSRKVENAASDGKGILINPDWARKTLATYCADQACGSAVMIGVLAHELIHHVYGDVETLKTKPWLRCRPGP